MTIQVTRKDGESGEKLLRRFSTHVKKTRLLKKFRKLRYNTPKLRKIQVREAAVMREAHRAANAKKRFLSS